MSANNVEQSVTDALMRWNIGFEVDGGRRMVRPSGGLHSKPWPCFGWLVTLTNRGTRKTMQLPYYCGLAHATKPKHSSMTARPIPPTPAAVLWSLLSDATAGTMSFQDWCSDYGYSDDSLTALGTYRACCASARQLAEVFTRDQMAELQTMLEGY
jgi:hypothetical protein